MKNLTQKIILAISLLGFVILTACGQAEKKQDDTANKTTKVEKKVEEKISVEQEKDTTQNTLNTTPTTNPLAAVTDENTKTINMEEVKTLTKPVNVATETSEVSLGAEQADDDLFSSNATDDLAAAKTRIETKRINAAKVTQKRVKVQDENEKLKLKREKLQKKVSELTGAKGNKPKKKEE